MKIYRGVIAGIVLAAGAMQGATAETLGDALREAYLHNPQLQAQRTDAQIAQEGLTQARSQWKPQVSASGSLGYESKDTNRAFGVDIGEHGVATAQLQAIQPIYTGGRISSSIRQAQAGIGAANAQLDALRQNVFLQTVTVYEDVRRDEEAVRIQENNVTVLIEQARAASDRFEVGEITRTDVALSEARLAGARAGLAGAEAQREASYANYGILVGAAPQALVPPPPKPVLPTSFEAAFEIALDGNPDLAASRYAERVSEEGVNGAYAALRPQVSIVGTASGQETYENNFQDSNISAVAQARVPLFQGGLIRSQVRSAKLERERARRLTDALERQVRAQVAQAFYGHEAAVKTIEASKAQVSAAEIAYRGAKEELAVGVRTTLNVLDQEQDLFEAQLALVRAEHDAYVAAHQLLRAMGALTLENLNLDAPVYDPEAYDAH
ncbi:MAG: TolC family outer membrane protein [Hyphomonadaceae bacterium]